MTAVSIVLVDDHGLMRAGLRRLLESIRDVQVVAEAENGRDAIAKVRECNPKLVLMDVALPVLNGLAVCRTLPADVGQ